MSTHSWWSPSAAGRSIACPASVMLNQKNSKSSKYADQGTVCHIACDASDKNIPNGVVYTEDWQEQAVADALKQRSDFISSAGLVNYKQDNEIVLDLTYIGYPDVFGTADILIYDQATKTVFIMDYKFGVGVAVSPHRNPQLMTYAVAAAGVYPDAEKFCLVVIQPRVYKEALSYDIDKVDLVQWQTDVLIPAIEEAKLPNARFNPGEDQCRWCQAANDGCPAQLQQLKSLLPDGVDKVPEPITNEVLSEILKKIPAYEQAIKQVRATAHSRMMEGQSVEGFKLVRASKNRTWSNIEGADGLLKRKKFKMDERYSMKLISPLQAEKALAAKGVLTPRLLTALKAYITQPIGDPIVVAASDKRDTYVPMDPVKELPVSIDDIL